jgi:hypothetical protein
MTFRLPKQLNDSVPATITDINQNFAAIETEINNLPQDGVLNSSEWVTGSLFVDGSIGASKLNQLKTSIFSSSSDDNLVSQTAIKKYIDSKT